MNSNEFWMEPALPSDRYADFCQWSYDPPGSDEGKLRQSSLLWAALEAAGAHQNLFDACRTLRGALGAGRTVYGVKLQDGKLSFEFYFYDYGRLYRTLSIPKVLGALKPYVKCNLPPVEQRLYFMFSLDLDNAIVTGQAPLAAIDLYIGNPGSAVSSGICYAHRADSLELKNFYFFFDTRSGSRPIVEKVAASAHLDAPFDLDQILWPEMVDCNVIVVANKRRHDGIYFSRIRSTQLGQFFERANWPAELRRVFTDNARLFDHLLFDIGIDYAVENGRVVILKSAFYGLL